LAGEALRRFDSESNVQEIHHGWRVRDVLSAGDGIYFLTNNTDGRGNPAENDDRLLFLPNSQLN